jgi:glutamine amidotransferase
VTLARPLAIVDYGMGNLRSVQKAFERLGWPAVVTRDAREIERAPGVVLPGVGAFGACMRNLEAYGLAEPVRRVLDDARPFLGICLGMQLLFEASEEFGPVSGLGILRGRVRRFPPDPERKVPHMGWNQLEIRRPHPVLEGLADGAYVYFVHSYFVEADDARDVATTTAYGVDFVSAVARDHLVASQFHPEKSQRVGLRLLDNFVRNVVARA